MCASFHVMYISLLLLLLVFSPVVVSLRFRFFAAMAALQKLIWFSHVSVCMNVWYNLHSVWCMILHQYYYYQMTVLMWNVHWTHKQQICTSEFFFVTILNTYIVHNQQKHCFWFMNYTTSPWLIGFVKPFFPLVQTTIILCSFDWQSTK